MVEWESFFSLRNKKTRACRAWWPRPKRPKPSPHMMLARKKQYSELSNFKKSKTEDLPHLFEGLNTFLVQSAGKIWWCKVTQDTWLTQTVPEPQVFKCLFFLTFDVRVNSSCSQKTVDSHMALHGNIFAPVQVMDLVKASNDVASLVVCTRKKNFWLGVAGFLWVTSSVEDF